MTLEPEIRERLHAAVDQDAAPPGLSQLAVRRGRRRRARRYAVAGLAAAVVVGATSAAVLLPGRSEKRSADVAATHESALAWARSLPQGPPPDLPYFVEGVLHDGDQVVPVPDTVITGSPTMGPHRVTGGWLVFLGVAAELEPAVLSSDGSMRALPPWQYPEGSNDPTAVVSDDGTQVAYGDGVLDLRTGARTPIPKRRTQVVRLMGFGEEGLVYQLTTARGDDSATWLLRPDGAATEVTLPGGPDGAYLTPSRPADVALSAPEPEGGCLVSWKLLEGEWVERAPGCVDGTPGETADVSPDGRWVITEDLPEVWDLVDGGFKAVDLPRDTWELWGYPLFGFSAWESPDTFLMAAMPRRADGGVVEGADSAVQLVRCHVSSGDCERAGEELVVGSGEMLPAIQGSG
ncbi:hypothetical protein EXE58_05405 [Nocardioides seonyuensis]|uniref:WD40 repeat domain-containing protein n=1 Tax=Nocardioides seonyuensis TaxID=2518371 RepID=A0A4P7ICT9_9ACTN|nr:hypothetical protein [Nocardioides seonyuensis]QBX54945.1 hypothetical protein EXE58_05405 [Nocardioides seonyuensis]